MSRSSVLKSSLIIGSATMVSRVFGLIRDVLLAAILGTGAQADAFIVAFRLPNLFRRLFAEGAFSAAFIPTYLSEMKTKRADFAGRILTILGLVLLGLTIIAEIFMEHVVFLLAGGFVSDPDKFALAVLCSRITFPYLIMMFLASLYGALLNAAERFLASSALPILLNIALILAALSFWAWGGLPALYFSWAVAGAGILQALMIFYAAKRVGLIAFPLQFSSTPLMKKFFQLILPALAAGGVVQINIIIGTRIASTSPSAVAHIYYAERLYQLPLAVIGIALGVALLPALTKTIHDHKQALASMSRALQGVLLLTLPASAALIVIAQPIIAALFEYGAFTAQDRIASAAILIGFACGLPAFVLQRVLSVGFFARKNTKQPFYYALIAMLINVALSLTLFPYWGAVAIAVATSIAAWVNVLALWFFARRKTWAALAWDRLAKMTIATLLMAGLLYFTQAFFPLPSLASARIIYLAALIILGMASYAALCHSFKLVKFNQLKQELL